MLDPSEAALLLAIAEVGDDNLPRLVYADWIEERGDATRAEFIRLQCEPPELPEIVRTVRPVVGRERELLNAHRRDWIAALGVPVEDVAFERGLVSAVRLKEWDGGKFLDPAILPRFATLTELDLSGLKLTNDDLVAFTDTARFPRLRKLILSDNALSDGGANRLAKAAGLPKLDTVYVFSTAITATGRNALTGSSQFRLLTLDHGERAEGYCMSRGQAEMGRRRYIRDHLLPFVQGYFDKYELLQSAMLVVAQYWDDEAGDAVHGNLIVSELPMPKLKGAASHSPSDESKRIDPNVPNTRIEDRFGFTGSVVDLWNVGWDENQGSIPLWAAFSPEGAHQDQCDVSESHAPAALFYRYGGYETLPMVRPHLDGIRAEWDRRTEE